MQVAEGERSLTVLPTCGSSLLSCMEKEPKLETYLKPDTECATGSVEGSPSQENLKRLCGRGLPNRTMEPVERRC